MLPIFCVRLAFGLIVMLPGTLLSSRKRQGSPPHPRFVRTQFLIALGLLALGTLSAWEPATFWWRVPLLIGSALAVAGAIVWTLEPAPFGRALIAALALVMAATIAILESSEEFPILAVATGYSSGLLLGAALTAMLVGHSYLIASGLAITPLMRTLAALFAGIALRGVLAAAGAIILIQEPSATVSTEVWLWLPPRWIIGLVAPAIFGWMAYKAARIRSTQSATGILYVVVVCTILGELVSLLLAWQTGVPL